MSGQPSGFIKMTELRGPSPCDGCEFFPACAQRTPDGKAVYSCADFAVFFHTGEVARSRSRFPTRGYAQRLERAA
jgi:hypothetical protein